MFFVFCFSLIPSPPTSVKCCPRVHLHQQAVQEPDLEEELRLQEEEEQIAAEEATAAAAAAAAAMAGAEGGV